MNLRRRNTAWFHLHAVPEIVSPTGSWWKVVAGRGRIVGCSLVRGPAFQLSQGWGAELRSLLPHVPPPVHAVLDLEWVKRVDFILSVLSTVQ